MLVKQLYKAKNVSVNAKPARAIAGSFRNLMTNAVSQKTEVQQTPRTTEDMTKTPSSKLSKILPEKGISVNKISYNQDSPSSMAQKNMASKFPVQYIVHWSKDAVLLQVEGLTEVLVSNMICTICQMKATYILYDLKINEIGSCRLFNHITEEWAYGDWVGVKPNTIPCGAATQGVASFCQHPSNPDKSILEIYPLPKMSKSVPATKPQELIALDDKGRKKNGPIYRFPSSKSRGSLHVPTPPQVLRPFYLVDRRGKLVSPFFGPLSHTAILNRGPFGHKGQIRQ